MNVDLIRFSSTESIYLKKIVTRVVFLRFMYVIDCSIVSVMIDNIKIKTIFDSETEINCMFKQLINAVQLSVR